MKESYFSNECHKESFENEHLDKCIEAGISANGTEYERLLGSDYERTSEKS